MTTTALQRGADLNTGQYEFVTCGECGIEWGMPHKLYEVRLVDLAPFWCPLGHNRHFVAGKSELQVERERATRYETWLANRDEDLRVERASHAATKGKLTKAKKRTANGVCPCCQRTFVQLSRHIATKHPEYPT